MEIVSDPVAVGKLAAAREDENWEFRSFLKQIDMSSEDVDTIVYRHYEEVSARIDCRQCGNCCCVSLPTLDDDDVTRLATGLGKSEQEVTERLLDADEDGDLSFNNSPCPLLANKLCTVYEHRPDNCRSFPHLHKPGFVRRLIQVVHNATICPIVYNVYERLKAELWHDRENTREGLEGEFDDYDG